MTTTVATRPKVTETARGNVRVGCSGWVYKDWRGVVYPAALRQRDWFGYYATQFDTVEINNTFYRLPTPEAVESWAAQAPPGFLYAVKLGAFGSHRMKLRDAARWLPNHLDRVRRLGPALGPNLVQLPPRWKRNVERLDEFLTAAPSDIRWAVELRDPSWLHDDVFAVLERHGAALCIHDLLPNHPWVRTTSWTFVRFHGPNALDRPVSRSVRGPTAVAPGPAPGGVARRRARTSSRTSTMTSTVTRSSMRTGSVMRSMEQRHPVVRPLHAVGGSRARLTETQRATVEWLRDAVPDLDVVPFPGGGHTGTRWSTLIELAALDLAKARLAEGHLDALAILAELQVAVPSTGLVWGVWTAEPTMVRAEPTTDGWRLVGEKRWCSGADGLDRALVSATAADGPRLFVVAPEDLEPIPGSWPALGMEATASVTMRFDVILDAAAAIGGPDAYVRRPGFWHGGAGVAACWFGGAIGVADRLRAAMLVEHAPALDAAWGRVKARLEGVAALLNRSATEIDDAPADVDAARTRAQRLRLVVEDAARATLAETMTALGAGPLAHDPEYARRVADLELYIRQLRPEAAAAEFGAAHADEPITW